MFLCGGQVEALLPQTIVLKAVHFQMGCITGSALKSMNKKFCSVPALSCRSADTVFQWKYLAIRWKKIYLQCLCLQICNVTTVLCWQYCFIQFFYLKGIWFFQINMVYIVLMGDYFSGVNNKFLFLRHWLSALYYSRYFASLLNHETNTRFR